MGLSVKIRELLAVCLIFMIGCGVLPLTTEQFADRKVRLGKYDAAVSLYNKLLLEDPENAELYYKLGYALHQRGDYDQAIKSYTKAIEKKPNIETAHYNRGNAQVDKGDCALATSDFAKTIELDPRNAAGYNNYAWILSTCPDLNRDGNKAVELAKKAVELAPDDTYYFATLAFAYAESGDFERAVSLMEKTISKLEKEYTGEIDKDVYLALESLKAGKPWRDDKKKK